VGVGIGAGAGGTGAGCATGTGLGGTSVSVTGATRAFGPGLGRRACNVSGSWVVAVSGTLGSTRLLNTPIASLDRSDRLDGAVIARLDAALRPALIGKAYW
jgi:hypothetical protein